MNATSFERIELALVACDMTENIVDWLEIIEIDDRDRKSRPVVRDRAAFGSFQKRPAVEQAGEIIRVSDEPDPRSFRQSALLGFERSDTFDFDRRARLHELYESALVGPQQSQDEADHENEANAETHGSDLAGKD
ncbi:hypothetical protein A4X03_0g8971 [Tilletia caries]|uniref:Uncharacterized protein n=1 Tax=Tilletia caries TaxID=13290 RepID=A0A8T8SEU4_9BASI|nr:hypothetical protein A4X03_0g8971 [Tilletia caries]